MKNTIKTIMYSLVAVLAIASVQSNADFLGIGKFVKKHPKYTTAIGAGALAGAAALGAGTRYGYKTYKHKQRQAVPVLIQDLPETTEEVDYSNQNVPTLWE